MGYYTFYLVHLSKDLVRTKGGGKAKPLTYEVKYFDNKNDAEKDFNQMREGDNGKYNICGFEYYDGTYSKKRKAIS